MDQNQEDVNGEKLTVKKWICGADFFTVYAEFSRFVRDVNGEKKPSRYLMNFFTVSFSRFAPPRFKAFRSHRRFLGSYFGRVLKD